jgi:hypothetical protein
MVWIRLVDLIGELIENLPEWVITRRTTCVFMDFQGTMGDIR